ncbi:MAG: 4-hydroxy-tetrahydrodipicolinate reductase [Prevotellaceae bacterium]|jgi:4-hydroxy-tetrahydrodipicolinate reductase|nr:4-hydroxy-tetrahydrodipicolinate reductase [Prevotellaceae bacterium]
MNTEGNKSAVGMDTGRLAIVIAGYGKMGHVMEEAIVDTPDTTVAAIVGKTPDADVYAELSSLCTAVDCLVDFSHHSNIEKILRYALTYQKPLVICTTGFTSSQEEQIKTAAEKCPIVYAHNTSMGINVMINAVRNMSAALGNAFDVELIEAHHNLKEDAPSGTAKMLLSAIHHMEDKTVVYGREGHRKREKNEIAVHAVRGGAIAGVHTVLFAGDDEIIEIKHTALSKKIFAAGALQAVRFVVHQPPGLYGMTDVLKCN